MLHCSVEGNRNVYITDLGLDKVHQYQWEDDTLKVRSGILLANV